MSYELRYKPLAHRGFSVAQWLEHRSAVSEGLRFDSSWGLRIFSLSHARDKTKKNLSLHFDFFPFLKINKSFFILIISNSYCACSFGQDSWILASFLFFAFFWTLTCHSPWKRKKEKKKKKRTLPISSHLDLTLCQYTYISKVNQKWIKRLLEPAHSCYGLSLHWFLGLAEYRYSWIRFMWTFKTFGINFLLFLGSCVIRKVVHSSWWELEKGWFGVEVGWAEVIRQCPFRWCVYVCGAGSSCKPIKI